MLFRAQCESGRRLFLVAAEGQLKVLNPDQVAREPKYGVGAAERRFLVGTFSPISSSRPPPPPASSGSAAASSQTHCQSLPPRQPKLLCPSIFAAAAASHFDSRRSFPGAIVCRLPGATSFLPPDPLTELKLFSGFPSGALFHPPPLPSSYAAHLTS